MKVFINKASNAGKYRGGMLVVAANTADEARGIANDLKYNHGCHIIDYCFSPDNWEELPNVTADYDTPQLLAEEYYED